MSSQKLRIPALVHHKSSGQGVVLLRDKSGTRRMVYLGKHGSTECERRYHKVLADYLAHRPITTRILEPQRPRPIRLPSMPRVSRGWIVHSFFGCK